LDPITQIRTTISFLCTGELEFGDWGGDRAEEHCCDLTEGGGEGSSMPRAGWLHT